MDHVVSRTLFDNEGNGRSLYTYANSYIETLVQPFLGRVTYCAEASLRDGVSD